MKTSFKGQGEMVTGHREKKALMIMPSVKRERDHNGSVFFYGGNVFAFKEFTVHLHYRKN